MKKLEELGISSPPWKPVNDGMGYKDIWCNAPVTEDSEGEGIIAEIVDTKDANMMGAAPDMYSALWDLCFGESMTINCAKCGGNDHGDGIEHCSKTCPLYNARAALAKASGIITVDMKGNEND